MVYLVMNYINREKCVISGNKISEKLFTFKDFPVFIGCTNKPKSDDILADLDFGIDVETGMIQLLKVLPLDVVYSGYHSEALGKMWTDHHLAFVEFLAKYNFKNVLEIGGSNGFIGVNYLNSVVGSQWSTIEPNPSPDMDKRINLVLKAFTEDLEVDCRQVDVVVHSHVFEHMYYPKEFIEKISNMLDEGKYHCFSIPNLEEWLKAKYTNCLNFEHTYFLSEYFADYLLSLYGFKILEKQYFDNHSIFYITQKSKPYSFEIRSKYTEYKQLFGEYLKSLQDKVNSYNEILGTTSGNVYLFGAHVFSQVLLNLGLSESKIANILDNSLVKEDKRIYGYDLMVKLPAIIKEDKDPTVLLNAGAYQDEITQQLIHINPNVRII